MLHPEPAQQPAFLRRASGCEDLGANCLRVLDGGQAYPTRGTMDEDALAFGQVCEVMQRIVDRDGSDRERRGRRETHRGRLVE